MKTVGNAAETHVGVQLRRIRGRRGLTQGGLAQAVRDAGGVPGQPEVVDGKVRERPATQLGRGTIAKIESQVRGVSVNELLALARALNVSPTNLLLPESPTASVVIQPGSPGAGRTPPVEAPAWLVRSWIHGLGPLDPDRDDVRAYLEPAPDQEYRRGIAWRHPAMIALQALRSGLEAAAAGSTERLERGPLARGLTQDLDTLTREVERVVAWLEEDPSGRLDDGHGPVPS